MRIIAGLSKGTNLYSLKGKTTRPTLDRVKEAIFNILQKNINQSVFLDLFSGSGSIGLEAASRGAKKVILCDKSKDAISIIKKNIIKTHLEEQTEVYNLDFKVLLKELKEKIDIVYIDPPYKSDYIEKSLKLLLECDLLKKDSIIIAETDEIERIEKEIEKLDLMIFDKRKYGRANILFIKK